MTKHTCLSIFFTAIFSLSGSLLFAQKGFGFETISTEDGLSQGLINDMLQDKEGFIWVATKGGLNRYDGYTFKVFTTDPGDSSSISSNAVASLLEDRKGRIWIGTYDGGVNVYNKRTGRFFRINQAMGLSSNRIESDMSELPDGRILVSPQGGVLKIISLPDGGRPVIASLNLPDGRKAAWLFKDEKGFNWITCTDGSIFIFDPISASFKLLYDGRRFTSLIDKTGKFVSTKFSQALGPVIIPVMRTSFIDSTGQLQGNIIQYGKNGALNIANHFPIKTGASGCNFFDFKGIKAGDHMDDVFARNLKTEVRDQNVRCLLLDRSGVLWVGTMGHGIYRYRVRSSAFHAGLPKMSIQRITPWQNGMLYVQGWRTAKLLTPEGEESTNPASPFISDGLPYTIVLQTKTGDKWLYWRGTKKVLHYTAEMKLVATYNEPVNTTPTEHLQPFMEDSKGNIWICGANGTLARFDPITGKLSKFSVNITKYAGTDALTQTNAFYEDRKGIFWLATEHGFARLEFANNTSPPVVKWYKNIPGKSNSLSYNYVSCFLDDPANPDYLWVCTKGGGLNRMEKSTGIFRHYTTKQGLPNDVVYGILADNAGNIWGSTNKGLFCLMAASGKPRELPIFRVFTTSDGLQADEFNTNAFGKLADGKLAFGGVNGINIFAPETVLDTRFQPNVFITGIQIGNKALTPGDNTGVLKETIEQTEAITLNHLQDVVTLEFSSLDFTAPPHNKYRYQLEGIDKEWVESGSRRTATYLHLPSGNYVFKVQGSNSQGIWSDQLAELKIDVSPPWWRTSWACIAYFFLIGLAIRTYLNFNVKKARLESQLDYEQREAQRVKELDKAKTQLYTNITHEFRTPLTVILGMAQQVIDKPGEQLETRMDMIVRNGRGLLNLVNQMLDLSKLETGKMSLQLSQGNIIQFLRYVVESFHSLAESQQKYLHFHTDLDALSVEYDEDKVKQIISNLLSNAIKFTDQKGNIYISITENTRSDNSATLVMKIRDTGIGIPEDQLQYIFDRFYQMDNSQTRMVSGTGIGLALTKELTLLMGGEITVKSPPPGEVKGSEFTVSLPVKRVIPLAERVGLGIEEVAHFPFDTVQYTTVHGMMDGKRALAPLLLLVEDNADVLAYTASCLPEYRLTIARDGREGFEIATEVIPDLIITDVMMPFVDGFELVSMLRSNESTSHIPVIMLTAKADIASRLEGLQQGADAYLEKPFYKDELLVRIKKMLEMRNHLQQYYLKKAGVHGEIGNMALPEKVIGNAIEDSFVKRVSEIIEENLADADFTVEKLSQLVFMSHSQFYRKLNALTGCSPNKFIRMIRLKRAKELLKDPATSVASVAMDCGFDDPGYFARVFKQEYNVSPQKWRISND
jgi:signal transduction histidine kinase/DNA-binding response OmpR family regulator/ligand-binding sensor domain-containing protein